MCSGVRPTPFLPSTLAPSSSSRTCAVLLLLVAMRHVRASIQGFLHRAEITRPSCRAVAEPAGEADPPAGANAKGLLAAGAAPNRPPPPAGAAGAAPNRPPLAGTGAGANENAGVEPLAANGLTATAGAAGAAGAFATGAAAEAAGAV
eukprot:scaffold64063_cov62-Phaeocystis_antarctica.AAC.1